jgi:hypothetical protein
MPSAPYPIPPYSNTCVTPPYNATNFTSGTILSTLQTYGNNSPNYPWNTGTDAQNIYLARQNISYFNGLNQQTLAIKTLNNPMKQYPQFKSQTERLMYIQGQTLTAARNKITGTNPSVPMGVPCSTIYNIISPYE